MYSDVILWASVVCLTAYTIDQQLHVVSSRLDSKQDDDAGLMQTLHFSHYGLLGDQVKCSIIYG